MKGKKTIKDELRGLEPTGIFILIDLLEEAAGSVAE